ncbi:hypothetical protein [Accumulibacter sp.]|nr:hypothetical protein [Accumulibacter sp.]HMZ02136.1 hypothetical protein [Burkholderiaceae bacterium]
MRHVFLALAALVAALTWANNSSDGKRIKRQMFEHPDQPTRLY